MKNRRGQSKRRPRAKLFGQRVKVKKQQRRTRPDAITPTGETPPINRVATSPRVITHEDQLSIAMELRRAGASFAEIGRHLQVSKQHAHRIVLAGLDELRAMREESAEEVRTIELQRIDAITMAHWPSRKTYKSGIILLKAMERRSRLLGLDAPQKIARTTPDGLPTEKPAIDPTKLSDADLAELEALYLKAGAGPVLDGDGSSSV